MRDDPGLQSQSDCARVRGALSAEYDQHSRHTQPIRGFRSGEFEHLRGRKRHETHHNERERNGRRRNDEIGDDNHGHDGTHTDDSDGYGDHNRTHDHDDASDNNSCNNHDDHNRGTNDNERNDDN